MRAWIGIALLAGSWMFFLGYYYPADYIAGGIFTAAAVILLSGSTTVTLAPMSSYALLATALPTCWLIPWPYKLIPVLFSFGACVQLLPQKNKRLHAIGAGAILAAGVTASQSLVLAVYTAKTSRSHDLPAFLSEILAAVLRFFSVEAAADGSNLAVHTIRQNHRLAATWDLLFDPVTLLFFVGAAVWLGFVLTTQPGDGERWKKWIGFLRRLALVYLAWIPFRAVFLVALFLQRVLRAEPDHTLHVMNHFFSPWVLLGLLIAPVLLVFKFLSADSTAFSIDTDEKTPFIDKKALAKEIKEPFKEKTTPSKAAGPFFFLSRYKYAYPTGVMMLLLTGILFTLAADWVPMGGRNGGRVIFVERHSTWEPTTTPYDMSKYGELTSYTYTAIYNYLGQYFTMGRLEEKDKIDAASLKNCDVLVIKTPTARYEPAEVKAVLDFVRNGGGVLFVGDHTNLYGSSTAMNDISRAMGFLYRDDLLFSNEPSVYDEQYPPDWPPHPAVQHNPPLDYAVSCSIDPGLSDGRPVMIGYGLWSMPSDYNMSNYHPIPRHCSEMRYGPFVQVWSTYYGIGRAMAYADSTIFSSFATFQPGKAELMRDMIEWLNHKNPRFQARWPLSIFGLAVLAIGLIFVAGRWEIWPVLAGACILGWGLGNFSIPVLNRIAQPVPPIQKPMTCVVIDRTTSDSPLSKGAFIQGKKTNDPSSSDAASPPNDVRQQEGHGFGMAEQWIGRLGYMTARREGNDAFSGNAVVVFYPHKPIPAGFAADLERYVTEGGVLIVFDDRKIRNRPQIRCLAPSVYE